MTAAELGALQRWMQAALDDPDAVSDAEAAQRLAATPALGAREQLALYADMIALRHEECLREDFPCLHAALGPERWSEVCAAYLRVHPPRRGGLERLGEQLPAFLEARAGERPAKDADFLAELARLERALAEVFTEADAESARPADFEGLAPERWGALRLEPIPALRLLAFAHDVDGAYQAWRERREAPRGRKRGTWLLVHRRDERVWRTPLAREQHALLAALRAGGSLDQAIGRAAAVRAADAPPLVGEIGGWFRDWAREGLFLASRGR